MTRKRWLVLTGVAVTALVVPATGVLAGSQRGSASGEPEGQAAAPSAAAPEAVGTCTALSKLSFSQATTGGSTTSSSFVSIPNGAVTLSTASTGCIAVTFTAEAFAGGSPGALMYVRATRNGVACQASEDWQLTGDDDEDGDGRWARGHAYSCVFTNVPAGTHTIRMQYRSGVGGTVFINDLGLQVLSRP